MAFWQSWLAGAGAVLALTLVVWVASVVRRDASLIDRVWGLTFVVAAWTYALVADGDPMRTGLVVTLVTVWGLRLSIHLTRRNWGEGEDKRYRAMRERHPGSFALRSLVTVHLLQAVIAAVVSLPLLAAVASDAPPAPTWLDVLGAAVWLVGFVFEAVGDRQLARFRADPANRGRVMDRGLWRYTRHPNYFGDATLWWGYFLIALATGAWWAAVGPALMTLLIVRVSGVALTDRVMRDSAREGYDEYVRRTNAFVPGPPRR